MIRLSETLVVALIAAGCSCTASHELRDSGAAESGTIGDASSDTAGGDAFVVCDPRPPRFGFPFDCTPERDAVCDEWARQAAGPALTGYSACYTGAQECQNGEVCAAPGGGLAGGCQCNEGVYCPPGTICASDAPGGPRRCVTACGP